MNGGQHPTVSVIMACYNAEAYVGESIASIIGQTFSDWELIVVDDASTDGSLRVVESFDDPRIRIVRHAENRGVVASRNGAIAHANGRYIAIQDADDVSLPQRLEQQVVFLEKHPRMGLVGAWAKLMDGKGKEMGEQWKLPMPPERIPSELLFRNYFVHSCVMFRREVALTFPYQKGLDIVEDYMFCWEVSRRWQVANLQEYLVRYRVHGTNITAREQQHRANLLEMFRRIFASLGLEASEAELRLHLALKDTPKDLRTHDLTALRKWLSKLWAMNRAGNHFDKKHFKKMLLNRWAKVCLANARRPLAVVRETVTLWNGLKKP